MYPITSNNFRKSIFLILGTPNEDFDLKQYIVYIFYINNYYCINYKITGNSL